MHAIDILNLSEMMVFTANSLRMSQPDGCGIVVASSQAGKGELQEAVSLHGPLDRALVHLGRLSCLTTEYDARICMAGIRWGNVAFSDQV